MLFIAKSAWDKSQVADKMRRGACGLEIQLLDPRKETFLTSKAKVLDDSILKYTIEAVHMPLSNGIDMEIEDVDGQYYFPYVCEFANEIARIQQRRVIVVIHLHTTISNLKLYGLYDKVCKSLTAMAKKFPNVTIAVENTPYFFDVPYSNVELVETIGLSNVGTCLDTCHAMMTERIIHDLSKDFRCRKASLEGFFEKNKDVCKLIHLADCVDAGTGYGNNKGHGVSFDMSTLDSIPVLKRIFSYYRYYDYKCNITLEVREDDFLNCVNFSKTLEACDHVISSF